jgi:hypothetical protein
MISYISKNIYKGNKNIDLRRWLHTTSYSTDHHLKWHKFLVLQSWAVHTYPEFMHHWAGTPSLVSEIWVLAYLKVHIITRKPFPCSTHKAYGVNIINFNCSYKDKHSKCLLWSQIIYLLHSKTWMQLVSWNLGLLPNFKCATVALGCKQLLELGWFQFVFMPQYFIQWSHPINQAR